jgi:hypothetical protein
MWKSMKKLGLIITLSTKSELFRPDFRPFLRILMSQTPSNNNNDGNAAFIVKLLNYFVTVELLLLKKLTAEALADGGTTNFTTCDPNLVKLILPTDDEEAAARGDRLDLGSILQNSISAENFLDQFSYISLDYIN